MLGFLGFNFLEDLYAMNPVPTNLQNITSTKVSNGAIDNLWMSRNVADDYPTEIPTVWDYLTIMNANFNGNLKAGNIDFVAEQVTGIRIKRRIKGTFNWLTLAEIPINNISDFSFIKHDNLNAYGVKYEYAFVPYINETELNYITNEIYSEFNGVFICDSNTIFKYYVDVKFNSFNRNNSATVFTPLGRKYPIVVSNALLNYTTGSLSGTIITEEDLYNNFFDVVKEKDYRNELLDFLLNKKAKVLKSWNGDSFLMMVVDSPSISYHNDAGQAIADVAFKFAEIGDVNDSKDLKASGLVADYV